MILLIYPLLCVVVGYIANQKGRSGIAWFFFSLLLSPLLGIIVVAIISSRKPVYASLEGQVRDSMLEARYASYIRSHKPAFSGSVVHDVTFTGERRRFNSKADAIAFCMLHLPADLQRPLSAGQHVVPVADVKSENFDMRLAQIEPRRFDD